MDSTRYTQQRTMALRVGTVERDACVIALIGHHLQGRLTDEDLERRQRMALAAVDADDLGVLLADLPQQQVAVPAARPNPLFRLGQPSLVPKGVKALLCLVPGLAVVGVMNNMGETAWLYTQNGAYGTVLVAGAAGYATHAVAARLRR